MLIQQAMYIGVMIKTVEFVYNVLENLHKFDIILQVEPMSIYVNKMLLFVLNINIMVHIIIILD